MRQPIHATVGVMSEGRRNCPSYDFVPALEAFETAIEIRSQTLALRPAPEGQTQLRVRVHCRSITTSGITAMITFLRVSTTMRSRPAKYRL